MISEKIKQIQQMLKNKGFDPGEIDGIWGRKTIAAVKKFQIKNGLEDDGIVGPNTTQALFDDDSTAAVTTNVLLPWFEEARHLVGTKEILGEKNNPVIVDWSKKLEIKYSGDDIPWCGLFVAHCLGLTLPQEILPKNPLGARQWENFGDEIEPCFGAVMVFWRKTKESGLGHVGFYVGEDDTAYQILGGNQSDKVCLMWVDKDRFLSARWPKMANFLTSGRVKKQRNEGLSTDEA